MKGCSKTQETTAQAFRIAEVGILSCLGVGVVLSDGFRDLETLMPNLKQALHGHYLQLPLYIPLQPETHGSSYVSTSHYSTTSPPIFSLQP